MPIVAGDLLWKFSVKTGAAGNSTGGTAAGSLGKYISTTQWAGGVLHDLFDVISGDENAASDVEYRCVFIHNNHATLTWQNAVVWLSAQTAGGAAIAIGVDPAAASAIGSAAAQAAEVATEGDAPAGVAFSAPTTKGAGLSLGDIGPGQCRAIWIRRTAANTAAQNADGATLQVEGDTAA
ncbi:MAG TPA: hypothetical protein VF773_10885 [Verrucomicrobiae bacterium]